MKERVKILKLAKNDIQETDVVESVLARLANVANLYYYSQLQQLDAITKTLSN